MCSDPVRQRLLDHFQTARSFRYAVPRLHKPVRLQRVPASLPVFICVPLSLLQHLVKGYVLQGKVRSRRR